MRYKMSLENMLITIGVGIPRTLSIFFFTITLSLPLGFVVYFMRASKFALIRVPTRVFISVMRGTPLMLQLLAWYFGPFFLFGMNIRGYRFTALMLAFVLNYAAYFAEIYRSGFLSIPQGQYEAAAVLGYSKFQTFFKIVLPQLTKIVLPSVTNEVITLVKDTSLAYTLAYQEVFSISKLISASHSTFMPFIIAGTFYYIFNYLVSYIMERIELRYAYYR